MSYIGTIPKDTFTTGLVDRFTSTTGTTVTLTHEISSKNDIIVFVNFVKQDSTNYSVGGTGNKTLTLGGTLVSSDVVEVHYLNKVFATQQPSANSVGVTELNLSEGTSGQALTTNGSGTLSFATVGGSNTPAFLAYSDGATTISNDTWTKVQFGTELFDSDNCYDNSTNYRFTPTSAGKYYVFAGLMANANQVAQFKEVYMQLYKNGSGYAMLSEENLNNDYNEYKRTAVGSFIVDMNGTSDYLEIYTYISNESGSPAYSGSGVKGTRFGAYKLIGA